MHLIAMQDPIDPTSSPGFLIGRVSHVLKQRVQASLEEENSPVSVEEVSILTVLVHLGHPERMKQLADQVGRDATTASRQVDALVRAGLVRRAPCPDDGRATIVSPTPKGRGLVRRLTPMMLAIREEALAGISTAHRRVLAQALHRMLANLRKDA